jgi:nitrate/TMAO reductase-like tetraheme cytochrome c subunit
MKKKYVAATALIVLGILVGFPLFSMTYYTMVRTSTPDFCASCHEIKPAVRAWRGSTHVNNTVGVVVDCMDCHLPAPQNTFDFFFAKTTHGIKDVMVHFLGGADALIKSGEKAHIYRDYPNATGDATKPVIIFGEQR